MVKKKEKKLYKVKVILRNLKNKKHYYENLTLDEARAKKTEQENLQMGRNPKIIEMEE